MKSGKRKILQWLAVGFAAFFLTVGILTGTGLYTVGEKNAPLRSTAAETGAEGAENVVTVSIEAQTVRDGVAQPSSDNNVYLTIGLDKKPTENVRVYYHTVDRTASAELGDYEAADTSVLLTPARYRQTIAIAVNAAGYELAIGEKHVTRTFKVVLYRAESQTDTVRLSSEGNFVECSAGARIVLKTHNPMYGYDAFETYYYPLGCGSWDTPEIDGKKTWEGGGYTEEQILAQRPEWKQLIDLGFATLAVKPVGQVRDDNHWEYAGDCYVDVCRNGTQVIRYVINTDRMTGGSTSYFGTNYVADIKYGENTIAHGSYAVMKERSADDKYTFRIENPDNSDDVWFYLNYSFRLEDYIAPTVVDYSISSSVKQGEKIGLTMRLSEPVQIHPAHPPQIEGWVNGSMLNKINFEYVCGEGTDSLYFEADVPSENKQITRIRLSGFENFDWATDYSSGRFAYNEQKGEYEYKDSITGNEVNEPTYATVLCNIDLRVPQVSVSEHLPTAAMRRAEVSLTLDYVGEGARLFYTWADSADAPSEYDYSVTDPSATYTVVGSNMNGKKWLHARVVSDYGKETKFVRGPYLFDNSPPAVTAVLADTSTLTQKDFTVTVSDGASGLCAGTDKTYMLVSSSADGSSAIQRVLKDAGEEEKTFSLTAADVGLGKDEYGVFYIGFYATDTIGNQTAAEDIVYTPYRFDTRNFFSSHFETAKDADGREVLLETTSDGAYVIDGTNPPALYIVYEDVETPTVVEFKKSDGSEYAALTEYDESEGVKRIKITVSPCDAGYAELYLSADDGGTTKISQTYRFYFTKNGAEETAHYRKIQSGTLLLNKVYQLPENSSFYYKDAEGVVRTALYGNTALPASFSSAFEAKQYVYYTELQDLYAVKINAAQANWLNDGSTSNFVKAKNESVTAVAGQVWIRYKSATWETSSSSNAWVYYYYGPSAAEIDVNRLSDNLLDALDTVSTRIVGYGGTVYLVGEGKLNALGEPYLSPVQVHVAQESVSRSASGTVFASDASYGGDQGIYASCARVDGTDYTIATNLPLTFGAYTKLYYKSGDSSEFKEIVKGSGAYLSEVLLVSGVYEIKELDENGMRVFSVYVDANAPVLNALILDANGESRSVDFDEHADGVTYNAKIVMFNGIDAREKDDYAYIAVYKYITSTSGTLLNVYTKEYLSQYGVVLDDGNYHIEVADRSGNSYTFVLRIDSTGLVCSVSEEPNAYVRVTCNRAAEQIASYEIVCNGKLLTSTYSASAKYTQSGYYEIYIRDIYGNEFNESLLFERSIPTVSWKYNVNGGYVAYDDETTTQMKISQSGDRVYVVTTSALLQFSYTEGYSFSSNVEWNENPVTHARTMKSLSAFVLTVWYTEYPDVYVTYICSVDNTPPNITARRETVLYELGETEELREKIAAGNEGDELTYSSIGYSQSSVSERFVSDGETVSSRFIRLSINDASGVAKVTVYLDGKVFLEETENFSNVVLSRYGEYRVEAADTFGNVSSFSFVNRQISSQAYFVDGEETDSDYSCLEYFRDGVYTKKEYGNESVALKLYGDGEIVWKITRGNAQTVTAFSVEGGELCVLTYKIVLTESGTKNAETVKSAPLLSVSDGAKKADMWYRVLSKEQAGADIFACFDKDGNISLKVTVDEANGGFTAEERVYTGADREPFYFLAELSAEQSDVALLFGEDEEIETNREERQIKINRAFTVSPDCAADGKVVSVKVYYSAAGAFSDYVSVYDGEYHAATFADEGMYLVEIENVYGNVTRYYLILSDKFVVTETAEFADGKTASYSSAYDGRVYANDKVVLTAYAENVAVSVTKDGNPFRDMTVKEENGVTVVTLEGNGEYVVTLTDEFDNEAVREIAILSRQPAADDGLLYGYNDAALKRDEGYTNRRLSVSAERLQSNGFVYVAVEYAKEVTVLYDLIGEEKIPFDPDRLFECVGVSGDGEYAVVFRDVYGNRLVSIVHYCGTPTLMISRTTRNSVAEEACDLSEATENGLWSNSALHFASAVEEYVFTVDGKSVPCPYTLLFGSSAEEGSFSYEVTYTDAYGFSYELTAHLYRRKIELALTSQNVTTIEGVPTTRDAIFVRIPEGATALYSLDGGAETVYAAGTTLYKDGTYRFTATDAAGNVAALTVKKDSAVEFELFETAANKVLTSGGIACTDRVTFEARNGDTAYIKKVFLDGAYQSGYTDNKFTESGRWELILGDAAGNEAYFCFFILTHSVKDFSYTAPYNYQITEVWYDAGDGVKLSYMQFVTEGTVCSFTENGTYSVVMSSSVTGDTANFTVSVNNVAPDVALVGCAAGETTLNDVTVSGYKVGDAIEVYRDGQLVRSVKIITSSTDAPVIKEGGDYTIVVRNAAGVETSLSFTRKHIPNTAGNVLIFVVIFALIAVITIGLVYRNHSKSDE